MTRLTPAATASVASPAVHPAEVLTTPLVTEPQPGSVRFALHFAFRTVVCVITFFVVFSICEGVKDLLFG